MQFIVELGLCRQSGWLPSVPVCGYAKVHLTQYFLVQRVFVSSFSLLQRTLSKHPFHRAISDPRLQGGITFLVSGHLLVTSFKVSAMEQTALHLHFLCVGGRSFITHPRSLGRAALIHLCLPGSL